MKEITLNSKRILLVEVPEWTKIWRVHELKTNWLLTGDPQFEAIPLPPGSWQLLFADPLRPTEEEAAGVVGRYIYSGKSSYYAYKDYSGKKRESENDIITNPIESWNSLVTSHGFTPGRVVGLIDKSKN